ncbi:Nose resistant to fluoxetine protein 6 [Frankliniella fusca]|uniref:Nose resistant to fluoxetine protein 6 n=1 Tax=Frankliniella fusca TaxID=407009 RepID=A0AAE1HZA6_9NEOP|nr:Nose resistant to fluoxetine protein 6 [Frankliniella fusca]
MEMWQASHLLLLALTICSGSAEAPSRTFHLQRLVRPAVQSSLFYQLSGTLASVNASCQCRKEAHLIIGAALRGHLWALKWIDSNARVPPGLLSGNVNQFGDFDECLAVRVHSMQDDDETVYRAFPESNCQIGPTKPSYCLASVALNLVEDVHPTARQVSNLLHSFTPFKSNFSDPGHRVPHFSSAYLGICAPSSCTTAELEAALQKLLDAHLQEGSASEASANFQVSVSPNMCRRQDPQEHPDSAGASVARLALWWTVAAVLLATFLDVVCLEGEGPPRLLKFVRCLSVQQNWRRLIDTRPQEGALAVLDGVRGVNALGLLVAHKSVALLYQPYVNRTAAVAVLGRPWSIIGRVAILYTDCFILLSGALAARALLRRLDRTKAVPLVRRLVDRYVRLTPLLLALVALCTLVLPRLGSGPMWGLVIEPHAALCRQHWWRNALYVHNFYGFENMCLTHTHQLGIDMQLFAVAPLLVYPLWRWPRAGGVLLALLAAWSTALRYHVVLENNLSTIVYFGMPVSQMFKTASMSYILPTHRLTVYAMGLGLGFALHRVPETFRFSRAWAALGWFVALPLGLLPVLGPWKAATPDFQYDANEAAQYAAFAPILWSTFVCWGILACARGAGGQCLSEIPQRHRVKSSRLILFLPLGFLADVLSWRGWVIFTRIAFALYLAQFPVFFYNVGSTRHAQFYTIGTLLNVGEFAFIIIVSVLLSLTFEMPFQYLWKTYAETCQDTKECRTKLAQKLAVKSIKEVSTGTKRKSA